MAKKIRRVITSKKRYLTKEEMESIFNTLLMYGNVTSENLKIHKITKKSYMIEIEGIEEERRKEIKEDLNIMSCTIYKTNQTLKELREKEKLKEVRKEAIEEFKKEELGEALA